MESTVVNSKQKLLNQEFTADRFLSQLQLRPRPIVHVATHGQFSSAPDQTFLLAWDQKLSAESLNVGVRDRAERAFPIELLILSACQTAKGDPLAPLGIAGMSINAGSRSTLASLWKAEDTATAELMREFYAQLGAGQSKAEALRQAQLSLLRGGRSSPYYWGNFVLLGSWL
jgi:CHAT domain-containing protein